MNIEWLIDCKPRPVQEEAILRSFYGYMSREGRDEHQDFVWLRNGPARGWGHFLEMRLGKTPTLLNEAMLLEKHQGIKKRLIFAPNTYKPTWATEIPQFGILTPTLAFETSNIKTAWEFLEENPDEFFIIANYESLVYEGPREFFNKIVDDGALIAADESIKIKNRESIFFKQSHELAKRAAFVRVLTGLPMTQGPHDLYSQLRFIRQLEGVNFYAFRNKYAIMGGFKGKQVKGVKNEDKLNAVLKRCSFVAKRKDWGIITQPEYYSQYLDMSPKQRELYREMDEEMIVMLDSGEEVSVDQIVTKLLKLQQISSGFIYREDGTTEVLIDPMKSFKMQALTEILENEVSSKFIVPYHYSATGEILQEALKKYNPALICSNQRMKKIGLDSEDEKRRFNTDPKTRAILLQIQAGKYGHTLTGVDGDRCTHMLFYENTYSLDDRTQIEMRNTAETQDWVNVYMDFVSSKVEQSAVEALQRKEDLVTAVFGAYRDNKEVKVKNGKHQTS